MAIQGAKDSNTYHYPVLKDSKSSAVIEKKPYPQKLNGMKPSYPAASQTQTGFKRQTPSTLEANSRSFNNKKISLQSNNQPKPTIGSTSALPITNHPIHLSKNGSNSQTAQLKSNLAKPRHDTMTRKLMRSKASQGDRPDSN
mmetsp:Transcript_10744/g.16352  ORF Transcript_10744/g.16352 Transcript_10744/m.16352 type:complete len:142 (+) Transcript_10744:594-1019(+)